MGMRAEGCSCREGGGTGARMVAEGVAVAVIAADGGEQLFASEIL